MKSYRKYLLILLFSSSLVACGGGGGGGSSTTTPALPSDATTITTANTADIARSAVDIALFTDALTGFRQEGSTPSTRDVIKLVIDQTFGKFLPSRRVASRTETEPCDNNQGSITFNVNETATSASGTITFTACNVAGLIINGSFSFSGSFNDSTGDYSVSGNGSLTFTDSVNSAAIAMNFSETGNDGSGSFRTTTSISVSGVPGENFLLTTTQPITGVGFAVNSGEILVEGAGGTRLRITVTSTDVADVFLDDGSGTFVYHSTISI